MQHAYSNACFRTNLIESYLSLILCSFIDAGILEVSEIIIIIIVIIIIIESPVVAGRFLLIRICPFVLPFKGFLEIGKILA